MEQDYKSRASGENQRETQETGRPEKMKSGYYTLEELDFPLEALISLTQTSLSAQDRLIFKVKLSKVPRWKIDKLIDYNGKFINGIWEYFEGLQSVPETHHAPKQLTEPLGKRGRLSAKAFDDFHNDKLTYPEYLERIQQIAKECE